MKKQMKLMQIILCSGIFLILTSATLELPSTSQNSPVIGTKNIIGKVDGVEIEAVVQSPSAQETSLQIICLFEYVEGDVDNSLALPKEINGIIHVDEALHGLITKLRTSKKFEGKLLETLLVVPPENTISAKKLLIIGLGDRNDFNPENMKLVGFTGMTEALKIGVSDYSHASDLKDAGINSPTADVASHVVQGAMEAYRKGLLLQKQNNDKDLSVKKISILSGPPFFEDTKLGIKKVITTLNATETP